MFLIGCFSVNNPFRLVHTSGILHYLPTVWVVKKRTIAVYIHTGEGNNSDSFGTKEGSFECRTAQKAIKGEKKG